MFSIKAIMGRDPSRVIQEGEVHTISYVLFKIRSEKRLGQDSFQGATFNNINIPGIANAVHSRKNEV